MESQAKIALTVPNARTPGKYFLLRLKRSLNLEPSEFKKQKQVFVISDIEGNFRALSRLLIKNKVIDRKYQWTFGEGHLVILGDCFDRGEQVTECLWLIYSLEERARKEGGYVHFILGNHEIMNLNGDWRYVHPKYAQAENAPATALYNGNHELWQWICTKNIIEKIGDTLFVHGGIAKELLLLKMQVNEINERVKPYYTLANTHFTDPLLKLVFNSENSPFWYRGYYQLNSDLKLIEDTLAHFKVNTIVTGHTTVDKVCGYFNNKVINVDTNHESGRSEALWIKKGKYYRVHDGSKNERIK